MLLGNMLKLLAAHVGPFKLMEDGGKMDGDESVVFYKGKEFIKKMFWPCMGKMKDIINVITVKEARSSMKIWGPMGNNITGLLPELDDPIKGSFQEIAAF